MSTTNSRWQRGLYVIIDPALTQGRSEEEAEVMVLPFRNGSQVESIGVSPWKIEKGRSRNGDFNDPFFSDGAFTVDEIRIQIARGTVFAIVEQNGIFRKDFFNPGNSTRGADVVPGRKVTVSVTGANPFGTETKGTLMLETEQGEEAELVEKGAASFHRQLVKSNLSSEYDNEIRLWLAELEGYESAPVVP